MLKSNSLFFTFLTIVFLQSNIGCKSMNSDPYDEFIFQSGTSLSRVYRFIIERCLCCSSSNLEDEYESMSLIAKSPQNVTILPAEMIYNIALFLSPNDIISLIKSHRHFYCLNDEAFWKEYSVKYQFNPWREDIHLKKICFAYFWFHNFQIRRAAEMGLPRAIQLYHQSQREQENRVTTRYPRSSASERFLERKFKWGSKW